MNYHADNELLRANNAPMMKTIAERGLDAMRKFQAAGKGFIVL
jgi:hypothetical protein